MTPAERKQVEAQLLMSLVCDSSKRIRSEDSEDPIRTEVEERLRELIGTTTKTVEDNQKVRHAYSTPKIHIKNKAGKALWVDPDEAVKVARVGRCGAHWKWVLKTELTDEDVLYEEPT